MSMQAPMQAPMQSPMQTPMQARAPLKEHTT